MVKIAPLRKVISRHFDRDALRCWEVLECGHLFAKWTGSDGRVHFSSLAYHKAGKRRCSYCEEIKNEDSN